VKFVLNKIKENIKRIFSVWKFPIFKSEIYFIINLNKIEKSSLKTNSVATI
jgi:hypothetical protein